MMKPYLKMMKKLKDRGSGRESLGIELTSDNWI